MKFFIRKILIIGIVFALFLAMIPIANYALLHFGTSCPLGQPCIIPVWFAPLIYAPSGVLFSGLAFVLRDILQRMAGLSLSVLAIICGTVLSYYFVDPVLAVAGCSAYFLSELSDTFVYTRLQRYNLVLAVLISACIGVVIDSFVFLHLAFHSYQFILGQIIGKLWMVIGSIPFIMLNRHFFNKYAITPNLG